MEKHWVKLTTSVENQENVNDLRKNYPSYKNLSKL